jgi:hypothetical protein
VTVAVSQHEHYAFRPPELDFYNLYEFVGITDIVFLVSPRRGRGRQCRVVANARDSTQGPVADEVEADIYGDGEQDAENAAPMARHAVAALQVEYFVFGKAILFTQHMVSNCDQNT